MQNKTLTSISTKLCQQALELLNSTKVKNLYLSSSNILQGEIYGGSFEENQGEVLGKMGPKVSKVSLQVGLLGSRGILPDPNVELKYSLALVFYYLREQAKEGNFVEGLSLLILGQIKLGTGLNVNSITKIQTYWALIDLATQKKTAWPAEDMATHVLNQFPEEPWKLYRAAMEALLERFKSAQREKLKVTSNFKKGLGYYQLFRNTPKSAAKNTPQKILKNSLVYEVSVSDPENLQGSCTCLDYQKSRLGICKHLAAVLLYLKENALARKKQSMVRGTRILWRPPTSFGPKSEFTEEICLQGQSDFKVPSSLAIFFNLKKSSSCSPLVRRMIYKESSVSQLKYLMRFEAVLKSHQPTIYVDSVLFSRLRAETLRLKWQVECEKKWQKLEPSLSQYSIKLFPYQKEGVTKALRAGRYIIADEMGLGKTVQGIAWAEALLQAGLVQKVVVVCPNALKFQWQREWFRTSGRNIQIIEGSPEARQQAYQIKSGVIVLNYELLLRDHASIVKFAPEAILLDEAQRIKNYMTKTAQYIKSLDPQFRLILTGTPMENRIQELGSLVDWIDNQAMPPMWSLDARLNIEGDGRGQGPRGVMGLDLLRSRLSGHFIRRRRQDVLKQLPKRTDTPLYLPVTEEQKEAHDELSKKVARLAAIAERRPLLQSEHLMLMQFLTMMRMISNGMAHFEYEAIWPTLVNERHPEKRIPSLFSPKLSEFRNVIEGLLNQNVKVVIFSQWQRMLRLAHWSVSDILTEAKIEAVFFTGAESTRRRTENIVRFHDDPKVRFFFATDAGGVGLNLQKAASVCINLETPWNPAVLEQRNSRIYRLGQSQPVQIFNLITRETIEERIQNLVGRKQAVFAGLFDGTSDEVKFEDNSGFYKQIQNVLPEIVNEPTSGLQEELEDDDEEQLKDDMQEELRSELASEKSAEEKSADEKSADELSVSLNGIGNGSGNVIESIQIKESNQIHSDMSSTADAPDLLPLQQLFAGVKIERGSDGSLKLEAPPESAVALVSIFKGMADIFGQMIK